MTTEEFEKELRRVKSEMELSEEQIQLALTMHRKLRSGEVSIESLKEKLGFYDDSESETEDA